MYEELVKELRKESCGAKTTTWWRAADAIEELSASVAGYEATTDVEFVKEDGHERIRFVPKWISVNERLPEFDKVVLVTDGKDVDTGWANKWMARDGERKVAWASPFADFDDVDSITHWMPLPTPPKEET